MKPCSTFASPVYVASVPGIEETFNISTTLALSPISLYALGLTLGPILGTSASELFGRQSILPISLGLSLIFTIVGGAANQFRVIAVARFFAGLSAAPCVTVTAGCLNDVWDLKKEIVGNFFALLFPVLIIWGATLGIPVGAVVVTHRDWRWTFWVTAILLGICILLTLWMPETFVPQIRRKEMKKNGTAVPSRGTAKEILTIAIGRPLHMIFTEPLIWPTALLSALGQALVFCFYVMYPLAFSRVYQFSLYHIGLTFLPVFIGTFPGAAVIIYFNRTKYQKEVAKAREEGRPVALELQLYPAILGSILLPISLFW